MTVTPLIPDHIDAELCRLAERAAGSYPAPLCQALGWTRHEYVAAIYGRLRDKYRQNRTETA